MHLKILWTVESLTSVTGSLFYENTTEYGNRADTCEAKQCWVLWVRVAEGFSIEIFVTILQWPRIRVSTRNPLERLTHLLEYKKSVFDSATTKTLHIASSDVGIYCLETHAVLTSLGNALTSFSEIENLYLAVIIRIFWSLKESVRNQLILLGKCLKETLAAKTALHLCCQDPVICLLTNRRVEALSNPTSKHPLCSCRP
jgi:hypothetical protein